MYYNTIYVFICQLITLATTSLSILYFLLCNIISVNWKNGLLNVRSDRPVHLMRGKCNQSDVTDFSCGNNMRTRVARTTRPHSSLD